MQQNNLSFARSFTVLIFAFCLVGVSFGQITGGAGSGQATPQPATKASLDAGPLGDNVNLFTGTLSLSYGFGDVATLSGLSFPISLAYEGSALQGLDGEQNAGIPYGEGWQLSNAFVTVDGMTWDFIQADQLPNDPNQGTGYGLADAEKRGRMYFSNPILQLPGGGGGRLIYKYPDPTMAGVSVYHLQQFDSYIEARFDGQRWIARTDDGTEWVFGLVQFRERNPHNNTAQLKKNGVLPVLPKAEVTRWHLTEVRNLNHPNAQHIVLDYAQFGVIDMHPELGQGFVSSELTGEISQTTMHIWTQEELDSLALLGQHPQNECGIEYVAGDTTFLFGAPASRTVAYRDVLLKAVTAIDGQGLQQSRAELIYHTWRAESMLANAPTMLERGRFLVLNDPQVVRRDSLYSMKTVWFRGVDTPESQSLHAFPRPAIQSPLGFEPSWRRIMHPKAHQNPLSAYGFPIHTRNPYKFYATGVTNVVPGWYISRLPAFAGSSAQSTLSFTHSVLESPRLDLKELPSGDIYELRTLVKVPDPNNANADMSLDFRVVSGLNNAIASNGAPTYHCPHRSVAGMDWQLTADNIQAPGGIGYWETGYVIKSTNGDIIKWNPAQAGQGLYMATATPFVLPNLPNEFGGFQIQIGPGSSNLSHNGISYDKTGYPGFYTNRDAFNHPRDSFELAFGEWFGTGAPIEPLWRTGRYGVSVDTLNWDKGSNLQRNHFWALDNRLSTSYNQTQLSDNGANQPTAVTLEKLKDPLPAYSNYSFVDGTMAAAHDPSKDAELWNVELLRITKNPWMLDSVIIYGPDHYGLGDGKGVAVAAWKISYDLRQAPIANNVNPAADPQIVNTLTGYRKIGSDTLFRNIFQLSEVRRLDVDSLGLVTSGTGEGAYNKFGYMADNLQTYSVYEGYLLNSVRDALGGKTTYTYDLGQIRRDHVGENPVGLRQDKSWEVMGNGSVEELRTPLQQKSIEGPNGPMTTDYYFLDPIKLYRGYSIDPHFGNGWNTFQKSGRVWGYAKAIVVKPSVGGVQRSRTEYFYSSDSSSFSAKLLFGRLIEVRDYDDTPQLIGRRQMEYAADVAYYNGHHYLQPGLYGDQGMQVWTPSNNLLSYEHIFLWGSSQQGDLMDSWFTRLVAERVTDIDPITNDSVVHETAYTHFDWHPWQDDPDGDYAELERPTFLQNYFSLHPWTETQGQTVDFAYPAEPSWQIASVRTQSSAMPGAYEIANKYYLWDIEPFITGLGTLQDRHIGSMRPFWLARRHGVRSAVFEERMTTYDGNPRGRPVQLSTWYEWDVFRDVAGDFVVEVDETNYGIVCAPTGGGPMDPTRHGIVNCVGEGQPINLEGGEMVAAAVDAPLLVQISDSSWWQFKSQSWTAMSFASFDSMPDRSNVVPSAAGHCLGGAVNGPNGQVKWFGELLLKNGNTIGGQSILMQSKNYGVESDSAAVTNASLEKGSTLVFVPHLHEGALCDRVHSYASDSALNAAVASSTSLQRGGPQIFDGITSAYEIAITRLPNTQKPALVMERSNESCGDDDPTARQNFIDWLDWQFSLRAIHQQVDTVPNVYLNPDSLHHGEWASPHNIWDAYDTQDNWQSTPYRFLFKPAFPTVCTYRVHERNMLGQVVDESDVRHLHTVYEYSKGTYRYWFDSCGAAHSAVLRPLYGLPLSVTVTDFEIIEQMARFGYQPNQMLAWLENANRERSAFIYDGRGRLLQSELNGIWRNKNTYGGWDGDLNATWYQRTAMNYVQSAERLDDFRQVFSRAFVDAVGNPTQAFAAIKDVGSGWHKRFVGKTVLDNWGRTTGQGRSYDKHNQAQLNYDPSVPGGPARLVAYEGSAQSRVLRASKNGNALNGPRNLQSSYAIIRYAQFQQETGITQQEGYLLWPGLAPGSSSQVSPGVIRLYRQQTTDEDGKQVISYSDVLGRELASLEYDVLGSTSPSARVLTLFARDAQGRVNRVIHPNKLETLTAYNLMGWAYRISSPDGGITKMMYNQAGDLRIAQDANLKAKGKFACANVDRLGRTYRELEADLGEVAIGNEHYWPLVYQDTLGIPFRSIHTIVDELDHFGSTTDPNAGLQPWAWHYFERSFPRLNFPEFSGQLVSETRYDFPLDSAVHHSTLPEISNSLLHPNIQVFVAGLSNHTAGRPVLQKVYNETGQLMELSLLDYDSEGRLTVVFKQFGADGIRAGQPGLVNALRYPIYHLNGSVAQIDIDLGCNGRADFSQLYSYDNWGRLELVSVRHKRGTDLVAKYLYDDALGHVVGVVHFAAVDSASTAGTGPLALACPHPQPADTLLYTYDVQDRLTALRSRFLDYDIAYDATNINFVGGNNPTGAAVVRTTQNWAGGVNGWRAKYKVNAPGLVTSSSGVRGFNGATVYGFKYDGLNRLVEADAAVMEQAFTGSSGWDNGGGFGSQLNTTRASWYGDARYAYDKVGNLKGLRRYNYYAPGQPVTGATGDNWSYVYVTGHNQLKQLYCAGQVNVDFDYDRNGNLVSDTRRGIAVGKIGRNDLPVELQVNGGLDVSYAYGAGGRIFKRVSDTHSVSEEYTLRGPSGEPLAVYSSLDQAWTFQIYGLNLVGEMDLLADADSVARQGNDSVRRPSPPPPSTLPPAPRRSNILPKIMRGMALTIALGMQQGLIQQQQAGTESRPQIVEFMQQWVAPVALVVVDAAVDLLERSHQEIPLAQPAPSPQRTSRPDTSVYPAVKFFVKDHLGNVRVAYKTFINDTSCAVEHRVLAVMDYLPYGGLLRSWSASLPEKWQSTGHERDWESGWDLRGARMYDAAYGRFLSRDPLGGAFASWSPYNYVLGRPTSLTDLSGLAPDGGGKDGYYPIDEEGTPITSMPTVDITAKRSSYSYLRQSILTFNNGTYIGGAPTLSRVEANAPRKMTEDEAVLGLDIVGTADIPFLSTGADLTTGIISFKNGDYVGGGLSVFAAVPLVGIAGNVGRWARRAIKYSDEIAAIAKHGDEVVDGAGTAIHHLASNKHSVYSSLFSNISSKYGLKLDEAWNKLPVSKIYHYSKHPDQYHDLVLGIMNNADKLAAGNVDRFIDIFREGVLDQIRKNPNILNKTGW